jgi:hypothetical protein
MLGNAPVTPGSDAGASVVATEPLVSDPILRRLAAAVLALSWLCVAVGTVLFVTSQGWSRPEPPYGLISGGLVLPVVGLLITRHRPGHLIGWLLGPGWERLAGRGRCRDLVGALVTAVASVFFRYRRAEALERAQLRWFVTAAVASLVLLSAMALWEGPIDRAVDALLMVLGPAAVGAAIVRYRLFEIDRIVNLEAVGWELTQLVRATLAPATVSVWLANLRDGQHASPVEGGGT